MASTGRIDLPPQYRGHALAGLDQLIEQAADRLQQRRLATERLAAAGKRTGRAAHLLRVAEERLTLLQQSRTVLISGKTPGEVARQS
jgi:hypothetical protein